MGNKLQIENTGLDHLYVNGVPVVEAEITITDIYKKVARLSSLAVQADPYFNDKSGAQKLFSELHGEGDRITRDILEEGARKILPVFQPLQRWMPEGEYAAKAVNYLSEDEVTNFLWNNPDVSNNIVNSIDVECVAGSATVEFYANGSLLGSADLPEAGNVSYSFSENTRNNNPTTTVECRLVGDVGFLYNVTVRTTEYDGIGWKKALTTATEVKYPTVNDEILVSKLISAFSWSNINSVDVHGVIVKRLTGSANVTINANNVTGTQRFLDDSTIGEDYQNSSDAITTIEILLEDASDDFSYDLIINTGVLDTLPSPRFEFDSLWNSGKIIYRWQNMDTRDSDQKLNYTSLTSIDIRIDPNIFDNVRKYLLDALKDYVLMELYRAIGYDKKYIDYKKTYNENRQQVAFWAKSDTSLQTQYHYAGA